MSKLITDTKKIDFLLSTFVIFYPNGKVISINKIKGLEFHIEYLNIICKNDKKIKGLLSNIDWNYYRKNPSEIIDGIMPIFTKNNYAVYMNIVPNTTQPTNNALMFLPQEIPNTITTNLTNLEEKLAPIFFLDIAKYNSEINGFETFIETYPDKENSYVLYEIINEQNANKFNKSVQNTYHN